MEQEQIQRFHPDPDQGLSAQQVALRKEQGACNHTPKSVSKTTGQIIRDNVCTLFNFLNFIFGIALFAVGSYKNMLFLLIVGANIAIGIIQEIRSKKQVEKLSLISMPRAVVIRDGQQREIPVEELVLDDVMVLRLGRQVCSDGIVLDGEVEVNESLLTGEADPVVKRAGDQLLSGSFIVSGLCRAKAERVGDDNYAARIANSAREYRKLNSVLMTDLKRIIHFDSMVIIPLGVLLMIQNIFFLHTDSVTAVTTVTAALLGMIPEGLLLLTSVSLAVSVIKLARRRTLVQELYCIESLSRVDVLCLDKTGTITEGKMEVQKVHFLADEAEFHKSVGRYLSVLQDGNPTSEALIAAFPAGEKEPTAHVIPFSSARKYGAAVFADGTSVVIGSPERVAGASYSAVRAVVDDFAAQGLRVVAVGRTNQSVDDGLPESCELLGLVAIGDKIRTEAPKTLSYFKEEGVEIKIISGDNPVTVSSVARRAGVENWDRAIDVSTLSKEDLPAAMETYTVFGRVSPEQKRDMIAALKRNGHTVAMTGDGVNDVMALKQADCSIAMASGSDAARQVAHLVLLDSDFSVLPSVVAEGRRVINNITRTASLYLVKTIFSFLLTIITLVTAGQYPFMPLHLSVISSFGVGVPTFFLALEPNNARIKGRFLETVLKRAVPGALLTVGYIGLARSLKFFMELSPTQISTVSFILTATVTLLVLLRVCIPFSPMRAALWALMATGMCVTTYVIRDLLVLVPLPLGAIGVIAVAAVLSFPLLQFLESLAQKLVDKIFKEVRSRGKCQNNM